MIMMMSAVKLEVQFPILNNKGNLSLYKIFNKLKQSYPVKKANLLMKVLKCKKYKIHELLEDLPQ